MIVRCGRGRRTTYANTISAACHGRIKAKYKVYRNEVRPGGGQEAVFLREPGVYQFLLGLRVKEGDERYELVTKFQDWVFEEVLPSIRRHGE